MFLHFYISFNVSQFARLTLLFGTKSNLRIKHSILQRPYWAANIKAMLWVAKERTFTGLVSLVSLLCAKLPLLGPISSFTLNLLVIHSLEIWCQFRCHFALTELSLVAPPQGHGMFTPSITDGAFSVWLEYEVRSMYDFFHGNVCRNSEQLVPRLNIPRAHFY